MKAVQLTGYGNLSQVKLVDLPEPEAGFGEVVIAVEAAGVIFSDTLMRQENYVFRPALPYVMGREVAGRIVEVGDGVEGHAVGDRVYAFMMGGGYAERVAVPLLNQVGPWGQPLGRVIYPLGDGVSAAQAVSHGSNLRGAHLMLHGRAKARPGDTILIHAASGGVGTHLVRLARAHGMTVIALAGSPEKAQYCLANGAHHAIEYKICDYVQAVKDITGGKGANLSINGVGGETLMRDAEALCMEGELLVTGFAAGKGKISPSTSGKALTYKHFATYVYLGRPEDDAACAHVASELMNLSQEDRIVSFPLEEVHAAHALLESGGNFGKIILVP